MKKISVVSGSRADYGLLQWPIKKLDEAFDVDVVKIWSYDPARAYERVRVLLMDRKPDVLLLLGDRFEILSSAMAAHLQRVPIAHIAGGDITEGSYDDAMRDCISRMASVHFVTSTSAMARLTAMGLTNVHLVGNPGIDYIKYAEWKKEKPFTEPYVVVSYQPETIDGGNDFAKIELPTDKRVVFMVPNLDRGSGAIYDQILAYEKKHKKTTVYEFLPHDEFLNLIFHCDEFIGNSSSMLYEAPELKVKTRMIGKRQKGRTIPWGDGYASERIVKILRYASF